jgi:hypothetical protein
VSPVPGQQTRQRLEARMRELGIAVPDASTVRLSRWRRLQARLAPCA